MTVGDQPRNAALPAVPPAIHPLARRTSGVHQGLSADGRAEVARLSTRWSSVIVLTVGEAARAYRNLVRLTVGSAPSGAADSCTASNVDLSSSFAISDTTSFHGPPTPPPAANAAPVPTSSGLALAILALGIAAIAWVRGRKAARLPRRFSRP